MPDREFKTRPERTIARDFENALVAQTRLSDVAPASIMAIMARECIAPELGQLYISGLVINEAFFVNRPTSSGDGLDRRLADFQLAREEASIAYGVVTIYRGAGEVGDSGIINPGHRVAARNFLGEIIEFTVRGPVPAGPNPDIENAPAGSVTLLAGISEMDMIVDATSAGSEGSVGSVTIVEWIDPQPTKIGAPVGGVPATGLANKRSFTTGLDRDSDDDARALFQDWLVISTVGTVDAVELAAKTYLQIVVRDGITYEYTPVASAAVEERFIPNADNFSLVVYVMGQNGQNVSDAVLAGVQQRIDGYTDGSGTRHAAFRGGGQLVNVTRPNLIEQSVTVLLEGATESQRADLKKRVDALIAGSAIGSGLKRKEIYDQISGIGRVDNATIVFPGTDTTVNPFEKLIPGTIDIQG